MKLYLVQHAAAKSKEEDPDRPLSSQGRGDATKVAAYIAQHAPIHVGQIFHSGKTRARETAELMAEALRVDGKITESADLGATDDPSIWAKRLADTHRDIMLVGHKPYMPKLVALLTCQDIEQTVVNFQKGGVVCLNREEATDWAVQWIVTPEIVSAE